MQQYGNGTRVHDETAVFISICMLSIIQCLQYIWFVQLLQNIINTFSPKDEMKKMKETIACAN